MALVDEQCIPCRGGVLPLELDAIQTYAVEVPTWSVVGNHHLFRKFEFPDFLTALAFVNRAGAVAEEQGHHPDLLVAWGKVEVTIWTHKINGLTQSDFILASKLDRELAPQ